MIFITVISNLLNITEIANNTEEVNIINLIFLNLFLIIFSININLYMFIKTFKHNF